LIVPDTSIWIYLLSSRPKQLPTKGQLSIIARFTSLQAVSQLEPVP
jgi:hypothetical protein